MDGRRDPAGIRGSVVHNRFANGGWESLLRPDGMGYRPCLLDLDGRGGGRPEREWILPIDTSLPDAAC